MGKRFTKASVVIREELGEGDWVDIRANSGWGAYADWIDQGVDLSEPKSGATLTAMLTSFIAAWGGPGFVDDEGVEIQVTVDAVRRLDPVTATTITNAILKHNPSFAAASPKGSARVGSAGTGSSTPAADA